MTEQDKALAIMKLREDMREIIRAEIKLALESYDFVGALSTYAIEQKLFGQGGTNYNFQQGVKSVVLMQMNKY